MNKRTAHIVGCFLDIAVIILTWWGCHQISSIITDVNQSVPTISFLNRIGFFIPGLIMPALHAFSVFEHFNPEWVRRRTGALNITAILLLAALIVAAVFVSFNVRRHVESAGYHACEEANTRMTFSKVLVYTIDDPTCQQLIEQKRKKR